MAGAERRQSSGIVVCAGVMPPARFPDYYDLPPSPNGLWRASMLISSKTRRSPRGEDGPGNCTLLHRTAAEFTSKGIPDAFGVLCHLDAPCRPSIRFLSISSRF